MPKLIKQSFSWSNSPRIDDILGPQPASAILVKWLGHPVRGRQYLCRPVPSPARLHSTCHAHEAMTAPSTGGRPWPLRSQQLTSSPRSSPWEAILSSRRQPELDSAPRHRHPSFTHRFELAMLLLCLAHQPWPPLTTTSTAIATMWIRATKMAQNHVSLK